VLLELLANLGADGGNGHVQRVHGLDLGGLSFAISHVSIGRQFHSRDLYRHHWHPRAVEDPRMETGPARNGQRATTAGI
jgi:hypothetical protein